MKTSKLGRRLLSFVLTLVMVLSMLAVLDITSFAATNGLIKAYKATAANTNGTDSTAEVIESTQYSHSYYSASDLHNGSITAPASFEKIDHSERYEFRQWKSTVGFYSGTSLAAGYNVATPSSASFDFSFYSGYSLGTATVDGAVYDTFYRVIINNATQSISYIKYTNTFTLPVFNGVTPAGQTFVAWEDLDTGLLYAEGAVICPDSAKEYSPLFADTDGGLVYFKDAETGALYHVEELDYVTNEITAPAAPSKKGYTFKNWVCGAETAAPGDVLTGVAGKTYTAAWEARTYKIDESVPANADIQFSSPEIVNSYAPFGAAIKFKVTVQNGAKLTALTVEGQEDGQFIAYNYDEATGLYSFPMPAQNVLVRVKTEYNKYLAYFKDPMTNQIFDVKLVDPNTSTLVTADVPVKAGYTFDYWYRGTDDNYPANTPVVVTANTDYTFYAHWTTNTYNVSAVAGGSSVIYGYQTNPEFGAVVTFKVDDTNPNEEVLGVTVEGTTGSGYYAYSYDSATGTYSFTMPAEDVVIRTTTKIPGFFVYFKDYSTAQIYDVKYFDPEVDTLIAPPAPVKEGFTFAYWYRDVAEYDAGAVITGISSANNTYYAKWVPNLYSIDITSQVGGDAFVNISSTYETYNNLVSFRVGDSNANENIIGVEVVGTEHNGYYAYHYDETTGIYTFKMPAEDVIIRVNTSIDEYAVVFLDENNDYYATKVVLRGNKLGTDMPLDPFKNGYTFDKWIVSGETGGYELTAATPIFSNLVVKATYIGNEFNLYKADDCDDELEYLYVRSSIQDKDLTDSVTPHVAAKAGDKVHLDIAPTPTYNITGVAIRKYGSDEYVVAPTLIRKYKDASNNDCYTFAFEMPISDVEIAVYVAPNAYVVNVAENEDADGTYRINGVDTTNLAVKQGGQAVIDILPEKGYYVKDVTSYYFDENNNVAHPAATLTDNPDGSWTYQFPMVSSDVFVTIEYAPFVYSVNVTDSNDDSYHPVWDDTLNYIAEENLDPAKTAKGLVTLFDSSDNLITDWVMLEPSRSCVLPRNITDAVIGDEIRFKVDENIGYDLASVTVTYADGTKTCPTTLKDSIYYFTMPNDSVVIRAYFVEETYKIAKITDSEENNTDAEFEIMGEVNINGLREKEVSADYKELVTVTATPKAGYFVESISYTLKDGTNKDGETVVDFSNGANYAGTQITDGADTVRSIQFNMPACDVDVSVTYGKIRYTVETEVTSGDTTGTITVAPVNTYTDQVVCTLEPQYGYVLDSFKIENVATGKVIPSVASRINQTYGADYTFDMPASKVKITAKFVKDAYTVTYLDTNNAYIGSESIKYKEHPTLYPDVVSVPNGYHFVGWVSADTDPQVTAPSLSTDDFVIVKNTVITAVYEKDQTEVIFAATTHGYVAPADSAETTAAGAVSINKKYQDTVTYSIVPDEGYIIDEIKVIGVHKDLDKNINIEYTYSEADGTYSFIIPALGKAASDAVSTSPVDVIVTFKKDTFALTKDVIGENGTVEVNGKVSTDDTYTYEYLDTVTITATPDKGYFVKSIVATMVDPSATSTEDATHKYTYTGTVPANDVYGTVESISFPMPATDMTYSVTYEKCNFTITSIVASGAATGTLEAPTLQQIDDQITFTITPTYGYIVETLSVVDNSGNVVFDTKDIDRTYGGTYKFVMPASPVTITVNYVKDAYEVVYKDAENSVLFTEAIKFMENATLNTTPVAAPSGYHFVGWISADTDPQVTAASLTPTDFVVWQPTVIEAVYEVDNTKVVFNKTTNGCAYNDEIAINTTKTAAQSHVYQYGDVINFTALPDEGYTVYEVKVTSKAADGVAVNFVPVEKTETGYSFVIPEIHKADIFAANTDDLTVDVIFCKDEYVLSLKSGYKNGTVEVNGAVNTDTSYTYDYLQLVTITATPDKGYYVKSIVATMDAPVNTTEDAANGYTYTFAGDKPAVGTNGAAQTISFPMPATDMKYAIVFEKCDYKVTTVSKATTAGNHGSVTVNKATAQVGDIVEVTADPDDGYAFSKIAVVDAAGNALPVAFRSQNLNYVTKYTFTMPASNAKVTVTFKQVASREYIDVRDDEWFYAAINFVSDRGYFQGYGASEEIFGVNDKMTRQDFVLVIAKMNGADLSAYKNVDSQFVDVVKGSYYAPAVAWAVDNGIIYGYKDGSGRFGVNDPITRQDIVAIIYRYAQFMNYNTTMTADAVKIKNMRYKKFRDLDQLSPYAEKAMAWAVGYGVLKGTSKTTLSPVKTITRSEVAQMIKNLYDHNIAR